MCEEYVLVKMSVQVSVLRGNHALCTNALKYNGSSVLHYFRRPNSEPEVDIKFLLRLRKPYKPGKGFFRHCEEYVLVKMSVQVSVLRGNHALCTNALKYNGQAVVVYYLRFPVQVVTDGG